MNHPMVTLISRPRPSSSASASSVRLGVVVAKSVARSAVRRNRLRRILRESFRLQSDPVTKQQMDCVLLARPATRSVDRRQEIDPVILKLINKLISSPAAWRG